MTLRNETLDVLCQLLQTGDEADRCYAARTLGVLQESSPVELLIEHLKDEDLDVAIDAAEALGNIGAPDAVPALIEILEMAPNGELCTVAAGALGRIGGPKAVDALLKIMMERPKELEWDDDWDTWWDIQREAVKALGEAKAENAIGSLVDFINNEEHQDIDNEILGALVTISNEGVNRVIQRLEDMDSRPQHRRRAARALAKSTSPEATRALGRALLDKEPEVRAQAALALGTQKAEKYLPALVPSLRDPNEEVRDAAIKAVIQLAEGGANSDTLQEALYSMLTDSSSQVRATLFNTLLPVVTRNPLSDENFKEITKSITDSAGETATAACALLGANGNPAAIAPLLALIDDPVGHPMARREAALSVGKLRQIRADVIETLVKAVGDKQQPVRLAALSALMNLENSGTTVADDEETPVRRPLEIVIEAVKGDITVFDESAPDSNEAVQDKEQQHDTTHEDASPEADPGQINQTEEKVVEFNPDAMKQFSEKNVSPEIHHEPVPEHITESITLPETPAQIVEEGEVQPAMSTLDAIAMENVEIMLNASSPEEEPELDEVAEEYLGIVEDNKDIVRRMRSNRKITAEQDVRRLGARVLAETEEDLAIDVLVQALNDDDSLVRREAAEAIGAIALRNRQIPRLMDALGTLITQMAVGDIEMKVTCARTLSYLGNRAALVPLMEATRDPESTVRVQAVNALARLSIDSLDPEESDHMVIRDVPPLTIARKLMECLEDEDMGARVAAAKGLAQILKPLNEETFTQKAVEKIVSSVTVGTGEEARLLGRALRAFDTTLGNKTLLAQLKEADDSVKRSVFIEMIEELLNPDQDQPEQAA